MRKGWCANRDRMWSLVRRLDRTWTARKDETPLRLRAGQQRTSFPIRRRVDTFFPFICRAVESSIFVLAERKSLCGGVKDSRFSNSVPTNRIDPNRIDGGPYESFHIQHPRWLSSGERSPYRTQRLSPRSRNKTMPRNLPPLSQPQHGHS
jgi:hypothetical protein